MSDSGGFRRSFRIPGRRGRVGQDVDEELTFHVDMRVRDLIAEGMDASAAEEQARVEALEREYMQRLEKERGGDAKDQATASPRLLKPPSDD